MDGVPDCLMPTIDDKPVSSVRHCQSAHVAHVSLSEDARDIPVGGPMDVAAPAKTLSEAPAEGVL
ncbi:hypothetical protein [Mangrovicoccus sp. HB161399]|uniref:hypothetical protein n=1 Tax=Mangrovicoccus sp. HB161399 TaxID=2720392 RepID=UPI001551AD2B|nr:hypothetical protein [Mangrovicoccus sp. HB161399]